MRCARIRSVLPLFIVLMCQSSSLLNASCCRKGTLSELLRAYVDAGGPISAKAHVMTLNEDVKLKGASLHDLVHFTEGYRARHEAVEFSEPHFTRHLASVLFRSSGSSRDSGNSILIDSVKS